MIITGRQSFILPTGVTKYSWANSKTFNSLLCFEALGALGTGGGQSRNSLYEILNRHHMCVLRPFKEVTKLEDAPFSMFGIGWGVFFEG